MSSYLVTMDAFCLSPDFRNSVIEFSLACWQAYPGMKIDEPLADPPHSVALHSNGTWQVLTISKLSTASDAVTLQLPTLDTSNLANILNHTSMSERIFFSNSFDQEKDILISDLRKSLPIDARSEFTTYHNASFELIAARDGWQARISHPKLSTVLSIGDYGSQQEARCDAMEKIEKLNQQK